MLTRVSEKAYSGGLKGQKLYYQGNPDTMGGRLANVGANAFTGETLSKNPCEKLWIYGNIDTRELEGVKKKQ